MPDAEKCVRLLVTRQAPRSRAPSLFKRQSRSRELPQTPQPSRVKSILRTILLGSCHLCFYTIPAKRRIFGLVVVLEQSLPHVVTHPSFLNREFRPSFLLPECLTSSNQLPVGKMNHTPSPSNSGPPARLPGPNPIIKRKKPPADPFFSSRKALPRRPNPAVNGQPTSLLNGNVAKLARPITPASRRSESPAQPDIPLSDRVSGFSDAKVTAQSIPYTDYKVVTTKRELLNGLRYHVMQLTDEKDLDIRNEADFSKPATLHRRDPRAQATNIVREEVEEDKLGLTQQEREELNKKKEARQKERAENLAQVAPSMGPTRKHNNFKKKTQQVFRPEYTAEDKRRIQTNYEEKLPWNLVDFDKKHCLVGLHQPTAAQTNVAFIFESAGHGGLDRYRLLPVEKVYHFSQKREDKIPKMTIEEVEKAMKRRGGDPEWLIRQREARVAETVREMDARRAKGIVSAAQLDTRAGRQGEEADLDFDDDFADDEEGDLFVDKDEDTKLAESKIKEDQLLANIFDMKEEKEYDEAEVREKKESEARRKNFKGLRKALERRERNYNHGSDSEQSWGTSVSEVSLWDFPGTDTTIRPTPKKKKQRKSVRPVPSKAMSTTKRGISRLLEQTLRPVEKRKWAVTERAYLDPALPNPSNAQGVPIFPTRAAQTPRRAKRRNIGTAPQLSPHHNRPAPSLQRTSHRHLHPS